MKLPGDEQRCTRSGEEGIGLVVAIFILVVLAFSGAVIWRVNSVQTITATQGLMGAKALFAAKAGVQWAIFQISRDGDCAGAEWPGHFQLTEGGLASLQVVVTCTATQHQDNSAPYNVYDVLSVATNGAYPSRDFAQRRVRATIVDQ